MRRYALRDDQWDRIKDQLPGREGTVGVTAADNRLFVEAVLYRYRAGIAWRDLPERFGDPINVHKRFSRWVEPGVWERVFRTLAEDADNEYAMIDSTIVRAHQHSAGAKKRRRRPGDWAFPRRTEHQNPHSRRRPGQSNRLLPDRRPGARPRRCRSSVGGDRGGCADRRQGVRRRRAGDRAANGKGKENGDPLESQQTPAAPVRSASL